MSELSDRWLEPDPELREALLRRYGQIRPDGFWQRLRFQGKRLAWKAVIGGTYVFKRLLDIVVSLELLIVLAPVFLLVAAANPCPCGYLGSPARTCTCTPHALQKYRAKFSGPLLDRIDMHVEVPALKIEEITEVGLTVESSNDIRKRVSSSLHHM